MRENLLKIYTVHSVPGRREFYPHRHDDLEIALFKSGRGIYSVTGHEYEITPGSIFLFSDNEIHKITYVDPGQPMEALNIHFPVRLLFRESVVGIPLEALFYDRQEYTNCYTASENMPVSADIFAALLDCERYGNEHAFGSETLAMHSLMRALILLMRCTKFRENTLSRDGREATVAISQVLVYIDSHFTEDIRLESLCELAMMSRSKFEHLFVRYTGVTVSAYVRRRRIDKATTLLQNTDKTILDISLESGYHNTANFNKQFRKVTGKTPREYRAAQFERETQR